MINSIKIITATILAVLTAQLLKLDFAISAGIVAILSVQPTKKETLNTAHLNTGTGTTKKQFCLKFTNLNNMILNVKICCLKEIILKNGYMV